MEEFRKSLQRQSWTDIAYGLGLATLCATLYLSQCRNKPSLMIPEGEAKEYKAEKVSTQTVVEVIDVKCMPNFNGEPQYFLVMKNNNKKLNGFTFLVEATPSNAYNMIGETLTVTTMADPTSIYPPKAFALDSWVIDSIHK
jgi:hypothetical protein